MPESPNFFAIIPSNVRYDKRLCAHAKLLYAEISALTKREGYCWASNVFFADSFETSTRSIQTWLAELRDAGHIRTFVNTEDGNTRKIWLTLAKPASLPHEENFVTPHEENFTILSTGFKSIKKKDRAEDRAEATKPDAKLARRFIQEMKEAILNGSQEIR